MTEQKKQSKKIYFIGIGLIVFAVLIVLLTVFVPRIVQKNEMRDLIEGALAPDPVYVAVGDPLFETGDVLGNDGKEVLLSGEEQAHVLELLEALKESGYRVADEEQKPSGAWDMSLKVRTADGETVRIWFTETSFYYMNDTLAVRFEPKDTGAYDALYEKLISILNEK